MSTRRRLPRRPKSSTPRLPRSRISRRRNCSATKGRQLKAEADKIGESLKKLKDNMAAYAEGLKAKAAK